MIRNDIWEEAGVRSSKGKICKKEHGSMGWIVCLLFSGYPLGVAFIWTFHQLLSFKRALWLCIVMGLLKSTVTTLPLNNIVPNSNKGKSCDIGIYFEAKATSAQYFSSGNLLLELTTSATTFNMAPSPTWNSCTRVQDKY